MLSHAQLLAIQARLPDMTSDDQREVLKLLQEYHELEAHTEAKGSFLEYARRVWPEFIAGGHHQLMANKFDAIVEGKLKRLVINMAPRHTKSEFGSFLLPSYFLGHFPTKKVIQTSNTADLASGFGRKVRNLIQHNKVFKELFPGITLSRDSTAAAHWHTNKEGEYFAIGVNGKVTGKGADLLIIDDPHSEQEAKQAESRPEIFDDVYDWYTSGPRQRLQPGAAIVIIMTRWSKRDLTGRLLDKMAKGGEVFEVITLPAILDENPERPDQEKALWPEWWDLKELQATRDSLPVTKWQAQYQQNPTSEHGAILKRAYWRTWPSEKPPPCKFILQSWDTAFTKTDRSNYSACTTWGVFEYAGLDVPKPQDHLIMLHAYRDKLEFPALKRKVREMQKLWRPDSILIEKKGSGTSLIQELRASGLMVEDTTPTRSSGDKIARANAVAPVFESGYVWAPDRRWADEVINESAAFPRGDDDDYVDTVTQAVERFRRGGFITLPDDGDDDDEDISRQGRRRGGNYR